ncbi:MAG: transposase [Prevotella sp.]|nr:transposase [Prevotella sp.]
MKEIVNEIFFLTKNDCMWSNLPGEFPPWQIVYWYY